MLNLKYEWEREQEQEQEGDHETCTNLKKSFVLLCFIQLQSGLQDRDPEYYIIHP